MKEDVPEFFFEVRFVLLQYGIGELVNLLHRHRAECVYGLGMVPGAFAPEAVHYVEHTAESGRLFFFRVHQ